MKILCLQLARLGDIYQTWPVLNALRRVHPAAEIDLLVREKFVAATEGLSSVDRVHILPTQSILAPLVKTHANIEGSLQSLSTWLLPLQQNCYDLIINLSFSPASSYLVDILADEQTQILGYTRHRDGFLSIADDASAYFYAQVGIEKSNRIHLTDLFALIAGVELTAEDFSAPVVAPQKARSMTGPYMVVQTGASHKNKTCTPEIWHQILAGLLSQYHGHVVLIGSAAEATEFQLKGLPLERLHNWAGQTQPVDLFDLLRGADLLLACDSMAQHIASLTDTPTLGITFPVVRFWETGPRAQGSRILWFENNQQVQAQAVVQAACAMVKNLPVASPIIERVEGFGVIYDLHGYRDDEFSWELVRALYMNHPFPMTELNSIRLGFMRLGELANLGLEQLQCITHPEKRGLAINILNQVDTLIAQVGQMEPSVSPVVRWFQTEKLRIGPESVENILAQTKTAFERLLAIAQLYDINTRMQDDCDRRELEWKS